MSQYEEDLWNSLRRVADSKENLSLLDRMRPYNNLYHYYCGKIEIMLENEKKFLEENPSES